MTGIMLTVMGACMALQAPGAPGASHPPAPDSVAVVLNLPAYRLDLHVGGATISYPVAIGTARYPTPRGHFLLRRIELNPAWVPPSSDWARDRAPMGPGPGNPMGRAKVEFLPTYYLHGTPEPESVGTAASHGCVRMRNADVLELGTYLLAWGRPDLDDATIARWVADPATRRGLPLERHATLDVRYDLIEIRGRRVEVHGDPYRLRSDSSDAVAQALLVEHFAPHAVPEDLARVLLDRARAGPFTVSADSASAGLLPGPGEPIAE